MNNNLKPTFAALPATPAALPLAVTVAVMLLLASCDVKDPIYNTAHPDHGQITLTTDWTARTAGVDIPATYTVTAGDYTATVSGATNTLDPLFNPGDCHLRVYNTAEHISIHEATITVASSPVVLSASPVMLSAPPVMLSEAKHLPAQSTDPEILRYAQNDKVNAQNDKESARNDRSAGPFVQEMPGWLFTSTQDVAIEADTDHELILPMHQQVRQLTLYIQPTGGTTEHIERIEGYLAGAASTLDMDNGTHSAPMNVALHFTRVTNGADAGKWAATVRLLGVAGTQQKLHATLYFTGDNPPPVSLTDTDGMEGIFLTEELAAFNADKATPLALGGSIVETPTATGFTATITDWTTIAGGSVEAN